LVAMQGDMFVEFMGLADSNTRSRIETCGILAGVLKGNAYVVTHLLIPKQVGNTDACNMTDED